MTTVPYALAALWDARRAEEERKSRKLHKQNVAPGNAQQQVPKTLRDKLKRSRCAKFLLQDLEEDVRAFLQAWESDEENNLSESQKEILEDDDYVLITSNPQRSRSASLETVDIQKEKLIFSSGLDDNPSARFV